jgi:division protein CdvB (Snf7/Vps24/ESCRT-III family)
MRFRDDDFLDKGDIRHSLMVSRDSLHELQQLSEKYEQSCGKLGEREKVLFGMIREALRGKDSLRANMYANELARVRHLKRVFSQSQLGLECISIRMESLLDLYNAIQMDPVSDAIKGVMADIQGISPEFTSGLEQLAKLASDTLSQATIGFKGPALEEAFSASSPESLAILREVSNTIEGSIIEAFPEPPIKVAPVRAPQLAEEISYGYEPTFKPKKTLVDSANDLSKFSDDFANIIGGVEAKGRKIGASDH